MTEVTKHVIGTCLSVLSPPMPARASTYDAGLAECHNYFTKTIYKEMERYLLAREPRWWGEHAGTDMGKLMMLATCLHDARKYSYAAITRMLRPKLVIYNTALQHNVKKARRILAAWGNEQTYLPTVRDRDSAVADRRFPDWMRTVRWWMDSTDVPLPRTRKFKSRKGIYWSGKLGRPAWRYMILRDGKGRVGRLWGGYSPKTYDAEFMRQQRQWLQENLRGTAILADTHFFAARKHINNPEILATPPPNAGVDLLRMRGFATTTKEAKIRSKAIKNHRGVVEQCFASIKQIFLPLAGGPYDVWREPETELDHVVTWAVGVHNRLRDLRARNE